MTDLETRLVYGRTLVTVDVPSFGWVAASEAVRQLGSPMHVLTAWNPGDQRLTLVENRVANEAMRVELSSLVTDLFDALGSAPDGTHVEESFAVVGLSREVVLPIGRRFSQAAIFELTPTTQTVVACDGRWSETHPFAVGGGGGIEQLPADISG